MSREPQPESHQPAPPAACAPGGAARVVRSRRKTLAIHVTERGEVEVRAPLRLPQARIDAFLEQKRGWVERHLARVREGLAQAERLRAADELPLLGRRYPVLRAPVRRAAFDGERFTLPEGDFAAAWPAAEALYRALAADELGPRVAAFAARMGVAPASVKVNAARKRWGSCSAAGGLNFAWRLVLAHPDAVDYVVVHELAHIRRHDHSAAFWREVEAVLPDYRRRQALLREVPPLPEG